MYEYRAEVVRIVDGDTVRLRVDLGFRLTYEENFRVAEVNTPELRDKDPVVKEAAYAAKDFVANLIPIGSWVTIRTKKAGKYGRWIAHIENEEGKDVSGELLKAGHAKIYGG